MPRERPSANSVGPWDYQKGLAGNPRRQQTTGRNPPLLQIHMYHGTKCVCTHIGRDRNSLWSRSIGVTRCRTPLQQTGAGPGQRIVEVVRADAQRVAEPAGTLRHDLPGEDGHGAVAAPPQGSTITSVSSRWPLVSTRPITTSTRTSSGVQPGQIDGGAHRHRLAADHRTDRAPGRPRRSARGPTPRGCARSTAPSRGPDW